MTQIESKTLGAVFLIAGTAIGAGMLALPVSTGASGLFASTILLLSSFAFMLCTLFLFIEALYFCPNPETNLIGLCRKLSGGVSESLAWILFLSLMYIASASYIIGSGEILSGSIAAFQEHTLTCSLLFATFFSAIAFFRMSWVDWLNRLLIIGLVLAFGLLIMSSTPHIELANLSGGNPLLAIAAIPTALASFTSHIILPSMRAYLDNNLAKIKKSILLGCIIPLLFYLAWEFIILGLLPYEGNYSLMALYGEQDKMKLLIEFLYAKYKLNNFSSLVAMFSFFALATSFWGVMISLRDFVEDGLNLQRYKYHKAYAVALAFLPPIFLVLFSPTGFSSFMHYAGIIIIFLYVILPIYLVYNARYRLNLQSEYTFPGGKPALFVLLCLSLLILVSSWIHLS